MALEKVNEQEDIDQSQLDLLEIFQLLSGNSDSENKAESLKGPATKLLALNKIEPTPIRVRLLLLFIVDSRRLTLSEAESLAREEFPSISKSVVAATLRLFKARNLLKEAEELRFRTRRDRPRGRPEVKMYFIYKT